MPSSNPAASKQRDGKKRISGPPPQPSMPAIRQAILDLFARPPPRRCPHCDILLADIAKPKSAKVVLDDRFHETCVMELMVWLRIPRLRLAKRGARSWQDGGG